MKKNILMLVAMVLALGVSSCRDESDVVLPYANNDDLSFDEAVNSYAGKFRVFWKAMNSNYSLWDYEKECGLDWDAHYGQMLPKFEALDEPGKVVTDSALRVLMQEMTAPLHDGHFMVEFKNNQTGNFVAVSPGDVRVAARDDYEETLLFEPSLKAYEEAGELTVLRERDTRFSAFLRDLMRTPGRTLQWAKARCLQLALLPNPTVADIKEMDGLKGFMTDLSAVIKKPVSKAMIGELNDVIKCYGYLNIPFLEEFDLGFVDAGIHVKYALFNDNIAYFYLSGFALSPYLDPSYTTEIFNNPSAHTQEQVKSVGEVWKAWYNAIQELHAEGRLKGVIIDVRGNGGGYINDGRYVLGSLLPAGGYQYGWCRYKRGTGRYDYSAYMPIECTTMDEEHEIVDDVPVVVLANCHSVSMSEMTSLTAKRMPNGRLVGKRTYGGLCALTGSSAYSYNYVGHIGVRGETPVYCYLPVTAILDMDKQFLDGVGVTPDMEVDLDQDVFDATGRDTQLDRALKYVREN